MLRRTLDMCIARLVVRSVRAVPFVRVEQLRLALELVDREIRRVVLMDLTAVCLQMRQMTLRDITRTDRLILPACAAGEQKVGAACSADLALEIRALCNKRRSKYTVRPLNRHVAVNSNIALCRGGLQIAAVPLHIDEYLAAARNFRSSRIFSGRQVPAAEADLTAIRCLKEVVLILFDIDKPLDIHKGFSGAAPLCLDRCPFFTARHVANLDCMRCRIIVSDDNAPVFPAGRHGIDTVVCALCAADIDIKAARILDLKRTRGHCNTAGISLRRVCRTVQRQFMPVHIDRLGIGGRLLVHNNAPGIVALGRDHVTAAGIRADDDVFVEGIVPLVIAVSLRLPLFAQLHAVKSDLCDLLRRIKYSRYIRYGRLCGRCPRNRGGWERRKRGCGCAGGAALSARRREVHALDLAFCRRGSQPLSEHYPSREILFSALCRIVVEFSRECIQCPVHGIRICRCNACVVGHHRDNGVCRCLHDMGITRRIV